VKVQNEIGIVDCGISNLGSISRAILNLGYKPISVSDPSKVGGTSRLIFPGQGSFSEGMKRIRERGWFDALLDQVVKEHIPILGICLGMQLLAESGSEGGVVSGLSLLKGSVQRFPTQSLRVPHIGWNSVQKTQESKLLNGIPSMTDFYFSHSYVFESKDESIVSSHFEYGSRYVSSVEKNNIFGTQFHPEKSSKAGRLVLKNFCELKLC